MVQNSPSGYTKVFTPSPNDKINDLDVYHFVKSRAVKPDSQKLKYLVNLQMQTEGKNLKSMAENKDSGCKRGVGRQLQWGQTHSSTGGGGFVQSWKPWIHKAYAIEKKEGRHEDWNQVFPPNPINKLILLPLDYVNLHLRPSHTSRRLHRECGRRRSV